MKQKLGFALMVVAVWGASMSAQSPGCPANVPKETVETLWSRAARGEYLTSQGWDQVFAFFTQPGPAFDGKLVQIMSDHYGVNFFSIDGTKAIVDMEYADLGKIDSALRYKPPPETHAYKISMRYNLVSGPSYVMVYGPDGKTLLEKKEVPGTTIWRIEGPPPPPWTTVNGAIRYVFEIREKTTDPAIKKNADETLAKLTKLH